MPLWTSTLVRGPNKKRWVIKLALLYVLNFLSTSYNMVKKAVSSKKMHTLKRNFIMHAGFPDSVRLCPFGNINISALQYRHACLPILVWQYLPTDLCTDIINLHFVFLSGKQNTQLLQLSKLHKGCSSSLFIPTPLSEFTQHSLLAPKATITLLNFSNGTMRKYRPLGKHCVRVNEI